MAESEPRVDGVQLDLQVSYDRVAEEYARRIVDELRHKPLDRELLERFAGRVKKLGSACDLGCGPGHDRYVIESAIETSRAS